MAPYFHSREPAATIPDFVGIPFFLISLNGMQLFKWTPNEEASRRKLLLITAFSVIVTYDCVSMLSVFAFVKLERLDYTTFALYWGYALNSLMKGGTLWFGRRQLEFILKSMVEKHPKTIAERQEYHLAAYFTKIKSFNKYLTIFHLCTTSLFNIQPMVSSIVEYMGRQDKEEEFKYKLPFIMYYYYNERQPVLYLFSYFLQCMGGFYMSYLFLGGDLLLMTLVHLVNMHFEYLIRRIESLQPTEDSDKDLNLLGPLVTYHLEILDYVKKIDATFSLSILLNYIASCLCLCLLGLQIVMGSDLVTVVKFFAFLVSTMVHVYYISHFGNNLIDLSTGISDAFYNHPWYNANYKYSRMLVLPIARAQRYAHLTAFQFFEISMHSFKSVNMPFAFQQLCFELQLSLKYSVPAMPLKLANNEPAATIQDFVGIPLFLLTFMGVKLFKWTPEEASSKRQLIMLGVFCVFATYNFATMILYIMYEPLNSSLDITEIILFWGFSLNGMMKLAIMILYRNELKSILRGLGARHPQTAEERSIYRLVPYYNKILIYNKYLAAWHLSITTLFSFHPLVASILGYIFRRDSSDGYDFTLPFMMWYYYDTTKPILYIFSYVVQTFGAFWMSLLFLSGDLLLISLVHLVNMHFDYLIRHIESFQPNGTDEDMKVLGPLLAYHQEILDYAERIDSTFSLGTLLNYAGSCLVLCLIGLQIVLGSEFLKVVKFIAFLVSTIVQVFFVSYFGNNLMDLSIGMSDAFYNHPWYDGNYRYSRMLVLPIARAQRYAHLTAFKFFEISMDSFKSVNV
ncbi:unnamed protein product [Ceratitis capitata]|uniref:(Mediterranean fruit fly) hypothetical protein n=1 Tax=Ceratitis capitata TaxID=7213 RepID=A0A811V5B0_CERCA|nr:unnamed protein product [Ceratitis capitata]